MTTPTIGELVAKHNDLLAFIEGENAAFEQKMKPYNDGIFAIKAACLATLQAQGQQNAKTEDGTAYQSTTLSIKVDNPDDFLNFVVTQKRWDMMRPEAVKAQVQDFLDKNNGTPPPGVKTEFFTKCNIRRT